LPYQGHDFYLPKPDTATPSREIGAGKLEAIAEGDQHIEGVQESVDILSPRVVDQCLNGNKRPTHRQRLIGGPDQMQLLVQIPVVQDGSHRDYVGLRQGVCKEIEPLRRHSLRQAGSRNLARRDWCNHGQIGRNATEMRMAPSHTQRELAGSPAHVTERAVPRLLKLFRQGRAPRCRDSGHRFQKLFQALRILVQCVEHGHPSVLDLALRTTGLQGLGEITPEPI